MGHKHQLDKIRIRDLLIRCIVGINPEEREKKQDVVLNLTIYADLSEACLSDDIADTVNYEHVRSEVVSLVENSSYFLVEKMAEEVARICLAYNLVEAVSVRVEKPDALKFARSVGVEIFRSHI